MIDDELELSPAAASEAAQRKLDLYPSRLPTQQHTWLELESMGVQVDAGKFRFVNDGRHAVEAFRQHWGWWLIQICGWYPYTELRDFYRHDVTGEGRPWLRKLPEEWQRLIFRELVLLIEAWNSIVIYKAQYQYRIGEPEPEWMGSWLSLTNEIFREGAERIKRSGVEWMRSELAAQLVSNELERVYLRSMQTWRPMMPERAEYHRKYADRPEYWTFERAVE